MVAIYLPILQCKISDKWKKQFHNYIDGILLQYSLC